MIYIIAGISMFIIIATLVKGYREKKICNAKPNKRKPFSLFPRM